MSATCHACSAVDNVLLKLAAEGVPFLRLGRPGSVHEGVREYTPGSARWPHADVAGLRDAGQRARVVSPFTPLQSSPCRCACLFL